MVSHVVDADVKVMGEALGGEGRSSNNAADTL